MQEQIEPYNSTANPLPDSWNDTISNSTCQSYNVSFANDIQPLFLHSCYECHSWSLSYSSLKMRAESGQLEKSVLIEKSMPPSYSAGPKHLTLTEMKKVHCWIVAGCPNN